MLALMEYDRNLLSFEAALFKCGGECVPLALPVRTERSIAERERRSNRIEFEAWGPK